MIAALFPSQIRRLPAQIEARQENAATFLAAVTDCGVIRWPQYRKGFVPSNYIITMNFLPERAGIRRETFSRALAAEGVSTGTYVPEPIHRWRRLQWKNYRGPVPLWLENLKRAKTDFAAVQLPNTDHKVANALEMGWTPLFRRDPKSMRRTAEAFLKVQDHLADLRSYEEQQDANVTREESDTVSAAKRAAAAYRRR
jgi:dTDP-4-amino-4,6-dideoxygalactose transaminase